MYGFSNSRMRPLLDSPRCLPVCAAQDDGDDPRLPPPPRDDIGDDAMDDDIDDDDAVPATPFVGHGFRTRGLVVVKLKHGKLEAIEFAKADVSANPTELLDF